MLVNWPPSKGPKPEHLRCDVGYEFPKVRRWEFAVKPSPEAAGERRALLEAVWDHHHDADVEEQIGRSFPVRKKSRKREARFILWHHVDTVASLSLAQADKVLFGYGVNTRSALEKALPVRTLSLKLDYPLTRGVEIEVKPWLKIKKWGNGKIERSEHMTVGYLLWAVALEYRRIYADWKHYKPWGHGIEDLYFETLEVKKGGKILLGVGS